MDLRQTKKPSFMMNVLTIIFSQFAVKLLGFAYRMVITNVDGFGDIGNGYYNFGFQIYTLLLALSSVGIPNAISKLVAERCALDDFRGAMRIFKIALALFSVIGAFFSAVMFFGADLIATRILAAPLSVYTIRVLSPSVLFVSVSSVIRGFFAGQQNMKATATSQVLEQFLKSSLTILIVVIMTGQSPEYMAAGATLATTISTLLSLFYLFNFYRRRRAELRTRTVAAPPCGVNSRTRSVVKMILWVSIPISLGSIITSLNRVLDLVTVVRGLETAFAANFSSYEALNAEAVRLSGMLSKTDVLINLPLAFNLAFATVLVPTIAGALAVRDVDTAVRRISFSMLVSIVIALPCTAGFMVLARPILQMIYPNASDGALLFCMAAPTVFFSAMSQTIYGSLQGLGKIFVPAISVLCGGIVKLLLNLILIPIPSINIYGAPVGSVACQAIAFFVSFSVLRRHLPVKLNMVRYYVRPIAATAVMAGVVYGVQRVLAMWIHPSVATLCAIALGAAVYLILIFLLRVFTDEDLRMLPYGEKLVKINQKLHRK